MTMSSIIVPAFNVAKTVAQTLDALLAQTYRNFEIIVVDDGSTDETSTIVGRYQLDRRVRLIHQRNRGLAGARNTGIEASIGRVIGFCDADDIWEPHKLAQHIRHLHDNPLVGVSYAGSSLIDDDGKDMGLRQQPRLIDITSAHILKRNPIGNGSSAVIRRQVFDEIAYRPRSESERDWYFDETFRQSEDIECWLRISLTTAWQFEGIPELLTRYRITANGLSAVVDRQIEAWERMVSKLGMLHPAFFTRYTEVARAYQLRYLARRAISDFDSDQASKMMKASLHHSLRPLMEEPTKTLSTIGAALILRYFGPSTLSVLLPYKGTRS